MWDHVWHETLNPLDFLERSAFVYPDKAAVVYRDTRYTYSEFYARVKPAVEAVSKARGDEYTNLALLTDGLRAEREQGITIDVAYRYFATPARKFVLADCPGHVQYTRNTVTGASTADVVVLHRVVCCYPDYERLLGAAADHSRRLLVFSHPPRNVASRAIPRPSPHCAKALACRPIRLRRWSCCASCKSTRSEGSGARTGSR